MLIAILLAAQGSLPMAPIATPGPANAAAGDAVAADGVCEADRSAGIIVQGGRTANSGIIVQGGRTADTGIIVQGGKTANSGIIVQGGLQPSASGGAAKAETCRKRKD